MKPVKSNEERSNTVEEEHQNKKLKRQCCKEPGCGKSFGNSFQLANHNISVHGSAKLKCLDQRCTAEFVTKQGLERHMWEKHGIGKGPKCDECGKRIAIETDLKGHMRSFHGAPKLECEVPGCSSTFSFEKGLVLHMKNKHIAS